jgi:hypothetical protein
MRLKADLTLLIISIFWDSAFVAVLLSQFKGWNLRGKIDETHLVEGR